MALAATVPSANQFSIILEFMQQIGSITSVEKSLSSAVDGFDIALAIPSVVVNI
jgi:hypothetical protein